MPIDPNIALGTQLPQMRSPLQTIGAIGQLREQQEINQQRQLMNEQRRRAIEDDDAIRRAVQETGGNVDKALEALYTGGRVTAASALAKDVFENRKLKGEEEMRRLDNSKKLAEQVASIAYTIKDDGTLRVAKRAIASLSPEDAEFLGDTYDKDRVNLLVQRGTTRQQQIDTQQKAAENFFKAWDTMLKASRDQVLNEKDKQEIAKNYFVGTSNLLSTAESQEEWDQFQRLALSQGAPAQIVASFGNEFSPEAAENARKLGMTAAEEATAKNQEATRKETERHNRATEANQRARIDAEGGGTGRGSQLTPNRQSEIEGATARAYRELEAQLDQDYGIDPETGERHIPEAAQRQIGARKLQIENDKRVQLGMPTLFDAETTALRDKKSGDLQRVRHKIRSLLGEKETPIERALKLSEQILKAKDPAKKSELRAQLEELTTYYNLPIGR